MIRVSFLLITVPVVLGIIFLLKKALQHIGTSSMIEKAEDLEKEAQALKVIDLEKVKQNKAEIARIKKEME